MIPPRNAMSVPTRIGTNLSACALVRVNRGSTWTIFAPRFFASITHWKPTGWASAIFDVLPGVVAGLDDPVRDHVHRDVEVEVLPLRRVGAAVADLGLPHRAGD